jgi:hypothetical protein
MKVCLTLDRSDTGRGSAYRIAVHTNAAHSGAARIVIKPPSSALIDGASDPSSSCPTRNAAASVRLDRHIASSVMARRRSLQGVGEGPSSMALRPREAALLKEAVAKSFQTWRRF